MAAPRSTVAIRAARQTRLAARPSLTCWRRCEHGLQSSPEGVILFDAVANGELTPNKQSLVLSRLDRQA
jgi:hypothetical protein